MYNTLYDGTSHANKTITITQNDVSSIDSDITVGDVTDSLADHLAVESPDYAAIFTAIQGNGDFSDLIQFARSGDAPDQVRFDDSSNGAENIIDVSDAQGDSSGDQSAIIIGDEQDSSDSSRIIFDQDDDTIELSYSNVSGNDADNINILDATVSHDIYLEVRDDSTDLELGRVNLDIEGVDNIADFKSILKSVEVDDTNDTIEIQFYHSTTDQDGDDPYTTVNIKYKNEADDDNDEVADGVDLSGLYNSEDSDVSAKLDTLLGDQDESLDGTQSILEFDF